LIVVDNGTHIIMGPICKAHKWSSDAGVCAWWVSVATILDSFTFFFFFCHFERKKKGKKKAGSLTEENERKLANH